MVSSGEVLFSFTFSCLMYSIASYTLSQCDSSTTNSNAPAGGVTGAVPHIVKKNTGIIPNLFIWKVVIVSHYVVYHNCYRNQQYHYHPYNAPYNHGSKNPNARINNENMVI